MSSSQIEQSLRLCFRLSKSGRRSFVEQAPCNPCAKLTSMRITRVFLAVLCLRCRHCVLPAIADAAQSPAVMAPIRQFIDAFNRNDEAAATARLRAAGFDYRRLSSARMAGAECVSRLVVGFGRLGSSRRRHVGPRNARCALALQRHRKSRLRRAAAQRSSIKSTASR